MKGMSIYRGQADKLSWLNLTKGEDHESAMNMQKH